MARNKSLIKNAWCAVVTLEAGIRDIQKLQSDLKMGAK